MEIKVICNCGAKYVFDVTPVQGRMPFAVNCPTCGADGTAQANEILQQSSAPTPVAVLVSVSPTADAPPTPPAAPEAPSGLRINRPAPTSAPLAASAPSAAPTSFPQYGAAPARRPKSQSRLATIASISFVVLVIGFGLWKFGGKWYHRVAAVVDVVKEISQGDGEYSHWNFDYEDAVVLYVQHTNHTTVAEACKDYWQEHLKKKMTIASVADDSGVGNHQYAVWPSYKGWVRIMGTLDWKAPDYEALSQHLSQELVTLVFETSDVDFSGAYHFGVYEAGARKFHAKMEIKFGNNDVDEIVTTEGNDWALAHGYKPGAEGFKEFGLADADKIAQSMGMKLWDEPEGQQTQMLILTEVAK